MNDENERGGRSTRDIAVGLEQMFRSIRNDLDRLDKKTESEREKNRETLLSLDRWKSRVEIGRDLQDGEIRDLKLKCISGIDKGRIVKTVIDSHAFEAKVGLLVAKAAQQGAYKASSKFSMFMIVVVCSVAATIGTTALKTLTAHYFKSVAPVVQVKP